MCTSNQFTTVATFVRPDDPESGTGHTVARAVALLKEVNDAPLSRDEQQLLHPACSRSCGQYQNARTFE
ncbi:MAG: hypothetical protein KDJ26_07235 [Alphaproteobacteria bacterium]|nr:hypothetical protein [Alphaproteobacteria bacterium]MCB9985176.1 hypothetical protein [Micavibrio sp.]